MQELSSPKENVAQKTLLIVTNATTKIKEIIVLGLTENKSQEEITKTLNGIIASACNEITNERLREETRKTLVISSRKWFYQLSQTIDILNRNLANKVMRWKDGALTADVLAMVQNVQSLRLGQLRPYLDISKKGLAVIEDYQKKLKIALKALAAEPPKIVTVAETDDRKGYTYQMSLRNRAEITARYEANLKDLEDLIRKGVEYVWTTSHPDSSPRCAPHQGKLYSLNANNKSGVVNGIPYTYLPDVLKLHDGNSIINGYNCRHRLIEYQAGSKAPEEYSKAEIKKEYAKDQMQRNYENNIRELKTEERLMRASGELEEAKSTRAKWRRMNLEYEIKSLKMGRAYYRWRTIVSDDEKYYTID